MSDESIYIDTLIGLLQAIEIEMGHIPMGKVSGMLSDTYRVISDYIQEWDPDFTKLTPRERR